MKKKSSKDTHFIRDEMLEDQIQKLEKDNQYMLEHINLLQKRFETMQDQQVRLSVEMDAIVKGVRFITDAAEALIEERAKATKPQQEQHYQ